MPQAGEVAGTMELGQDSTLLTIRLKDRKLAGKFAWTPGQFIEVGLPGYGEIPLGLASNPFDRKAFQVSVRGVGSVSSALRRLGKGDAVGIRGPFGNGFPVRDMEGRQVLVVAGGCGIPPLRSLIEYALAGKKFKSVTMLYGSKTEADLLFRHDYGRWVRGGVDVRLTVDNSSEGWADRLAVSCASGVVTKLLDEVEIRKGAYACLCGPPVMYRFVAKRLKELGVSPSRILLSLERRMKCGVGKCQHCTVNRRYVCLDGPVFTYEEVMKGYGGM